MARENQGLQIALIIFVMLTIILGVTTFLYVRQYGEAAKNASEMEQKANEVLEADKGKLKNTVRRSEMAAGMRGRAYADQAMAGTLSQVADGLDRGEV